MSGIPEVLDSDTTYLGDGAFAGHDHHQFWIWCEREDGVHKVALAYSAIIELYRYARRTAKIGEHG